MLYNNSNRYDGGWKAGKRQGYGILSAKKGTITIFKGTWTDDINETGKGSMRYEDKWGKG